MGFFSATALTGDRWDVVDGWQQGRGAWGGLVVAAALRHAGEHVGERTLRSVSCHLMAPVVVGSMRIDSYVLRAGTGMTTVRTVISDDKGAPCVDTVSIWGFDRADDIDPPYESWGVAHMPDVPDWRDTDIAPVAPPLGPAFAQHLQFRVIEGFPMSGTSRVLGWIGLREPIAQWDAAHLVGLVDAWWPGAISRAAAMRPMATVAFSAQLLVDPSTVAADEPLLHEAWISRAEGGFTAETRRLWTPDGRLAVENFQSIAIIR